MEHLEQIYFMIFINYSFKNSLNYLKELKFFSISYNQILQLILKAYFDHFLIDLLCITNNFNNFKNLFFFIKCIKIAQSDLK